MALAALILASAEVDGTAPIAGLSLIELHLRRLRGAGTTRVVILGERMMPLPRPPAGETIEQVASLAEAAGRLHDATRVIVSDLAWLPSDRLVREFATGPVPALAVVDDRAGHQSFERIDAGARWAGLALVDGHRLMETATMLGEWDPASTLLRRTVQEGAARLDGSDRPPVPVRAVSDRQLAQGALIAQTRPSPLRWAARLIEAPLAEALLGVALARTLPLRLFPLAGSALALAGGAAALAGSRWGALAPLLLAGPLLRLGRRMADVQMTPPHDRWPQGALALGAALAAVGLGGSLAGQTGQWGWLLVGLLLAALLHASHWLRGPAMLPAERRWLAEPRGCVWLLLPFALAGQWSAGLAATTLYAALSLVWIIRRTAQPDERV